ncbi:DUF6541 family protein [Tersicoccus sp. Bi-70]|uniref:DUF6541 family protein n=1 Tax=Tersicoccus sp. Bi-70 TaxID=1897634 RepID=UPI0009777A32|nr:DUF6541 family protein [Tersicoccus sp. Bi-70]OMH35192.1 hypothetical protein BGP79_02505 [Tersicoccus sp. Bi-70]
MSTVPLLAAAAALIVLPGGLVAWLWGARGLTLWGTAPVVSIAIASAGAVATQLAHVRWNALTYVGVTVAVLLVSFVLRLLWTLARRRTLRPTTGATALTRPAYHWTSLATVLAALGVPLVVIGVRFAQIFGHPDGISQTYDNVFHQNALQFIDQTGRGSSLTLGTLDASSNAISFYPAAWHDIIAVINSALPVNGIVATNLGNLVIGALVWPATSVLLTRTLFGFRPLLLIATGVLSTGFGIFPYLLVDFGVLYPNFLGLVLLPAVLAVIAHLLRLSTNLTRRPVRDLVLAASGLTALMLAHPSVGLTLLAVALPFVLVWSLRLTWRLPLAVRPLRLLAGLVAPAVYLLALATAWNSFRPSKAASFWPPLGSVGQAWGEAVTSSPLGRPVPLLIAVLTVLGVAAIVRWRSLPGYCLLAATAITMWFYVVSAGFAKDDVRDAITRVWYNDSYRTGAQLAIMTLPVAACGAAWLAGALWSWLAGRIPTGSPQRTTVTALAGSAVLTLALFLGTSDASVTDEQNHATDTYRLTDQSQLLTTDEAALLKRLPAKTPADAVVAGVPGNGSALAYALGDRTSLLMTASATPSGVESVLYTRLGKITTDPEVCGAARELKVTHVLDFGTQEINKMVHTYPGFANLAQNSGLTLVDSEGQAKLYRLSACDQ